jgi:hypothetical protein
MNFQKTILENIDPDIASRFVSRREAVGTLGKFSAAGFALASVPVALGLLSKASFAKGGTPQDVTSVLKFALTLEYLEAAFYNKGLAAAGLIPTGDLPIFQQIAKHENAHIKLLQGALMGNSFNSPSFDFTAGGKFGDVFSNYQTFLALSQGFEDTGVRAYKGQAPNLQSSRPTLTIALQIHSVEARHASVVRKLRGQKSWITQNQTDVSALAAVYAGDDMTTELGVNVPNVSGVGNDGVSESFDEPLTMDAVLAIAGQFIM